jgi:hypothetical protein
LQYHCRGSDRGDFMRAYIMIVALPVFGLFALIYTARTHDRTYARFNCTVECSGHEAGYRWAEQHSIDDEKTIARMAIPNPFMKAVSPMSGEWLIKRITASGWGRL